jgi:type I restriction enzyme S subunit
MQPKSGDVMFAKMKETEKVFLIGSKEADEYLFSTEFMILRPNRDKILPEYLYHYVKCKKFQRKKNSLCHGATQKAINNKDMVYFQMELPSLEEQKKIVATLKRVENIYNRRKTSDIKSNRLLLSIFRKFFFSTDNNWGVKRFSNLIVEFKYGTSEKSTTDGTPLLRIPNVIRDNIDSNDLKYIQLSDKEKETLILKKNDILFVRTNGNPDYVGRCAVFNLDGEYSFASYLIRARIKLDVLNPFYLAYFLRTKEGKLMLRRMDLIHQVLFLP